jgi:hypothetical protein
MEPSVICHVFPFDIYHVKYFLFFYAGHVARMGEKRNMYRLLVGKPEGRDH